MNRPDFNSSKNNRNNFTLLKLLAAYFVLVSNSYVVLQKTDNQPALFYNGKNITFGSIGFSIFFTVSGFLLTQSLFNSDSLKHYLWKRFLRVFPALIVANLICIFAGSFITNLSVRDYLFNNATWSYLFKNSTLVVNQFSLPGVFSNLKDHTVNASLWSMAIGAGCFLLLFVGAYFIVIRKWLHLACFVLFEVLRVYLRVKDNYEISHLNINSIFTFGTFFYAGSLLYVFKDDIQFKWFYANILMAIALATVYTFLEPITISIFFAYCFIIIGTSKEIINLKGYDFSYGVYLYAFPIQQVLILYLGYSINVWFHVVISVVVATIAAHFSWTFIEKPFLKKKNQANRALYFKYGNDRSKR